MIRETQRHEISLDFDIPEKEGYRKFSITVQLSDYPKETQKQLLSLLAALNDAGEYWVERWKR